MLFTVIIIILEFAIVSYKILYISNDLSNQEHIINFLNNVRINNGGGWSLWWASAWESVINFRIGSEVYDTRTTAWDYPIVPDWYTEWQEVTPSEYIAVE